METNRQFKTSTMNLVLPNADYSVVMSEQPLCPEGEVNGVCAGTQLILTLHAFPTSSRLIK